MDSESRENIPPIHQNNGKQIDNPPRKGLINRRQFLKGLAAATGIAALSGGGAAAYWTEPISHDESKLHNKESILNKEYLKQHLYSVLDEQITEVEKEYQNDLTPQNLDINDLKPAWQNVLKGLEHIEVMRNRAAFNSEDAAKIISFLRVYNIPSPFEGLMKDGRVPTESVDERVLKANHLNVLKYEAYIALRYLVSRGLADQSVLDEFQLDGVLSHIYTDTWGLTNWRYLEKGKEYKYPIEDPFKFDSADSSKDNLEFTDKLIQKYWNDIKEAGQEFGIDPNCIAALISMEARDEKLYNLYWNDAAEKDQKSLAEYLMQDKPEKNSFKAKVIEKLAWLNENEWTKRILPDEIPEGWVDNLSGLAGQNNSIGLGQLRPQNMKRLDFLKLFDNRRVKNTAPSQLWAALLMIPQVNIRATAATVRQLTDEYNHLQDEGLNLYLPDLSMNNPSIENRAHKLDDPYFGSNFGIAAYGQWYNDGPYPETMDPDPHSIEHVVKLRDPDIQIWGNSVASYFKHYQNNADQLGLK